MSVSTNNGKNIETLIAEDPKLLVSPDNIRKVEDRISYQHLFSLSGNKLETYNLMGFIGLNQTRITISSRFS
jgi:P pilus assembly chaperone PapD